MLVQLNCCCFETPVVLFADRLELLTWMVSRSNCSVVRLDNEELAVNKSTFDFFISCLAVGFYILKLVHLLGLQLLHCGFLISWFGGVTVCLFSGKPSLLMCSLTPAVKCRFVMRFCSLQMINFSKSKQPVAFTPSRYFHYVPLLMISKSKKKKKKITIMWS